VINLVVTVLLLCIGLCGTLVNKRAVGHATRGQSPAYETDKTTVPVSQTDFNGQPKQ